MSIIVALLAINLKQRSTIKDLNNLTASMYVDNENLQYQLVSCKQLVKNQ